MGKNQITPSLLYDTKNASILKPGNDKIGKQKI
jgi:hypothetical protein